MNFGGTEYEAAEKMGLDRNGFFHCGSSAGDRCVRNGRADNRQQMYERDLDTDQLVDRCSCIVFSSGECDAEAPVLSPLQGAECQPVAEAGNDPLLFQMRRSIEIR